MAVNNAYTDDVHVMKEHVEYVFELLKNTLEGITEEELDWRPTEEANNIRWILTHISRIYNTTLTGRIAGNPDYIPKNWDKDYEKKHHSLEKLLKDIEIGKIAVIEGLSDISKSDLEVEMPLWGGMVKRKFGVFNHISEIAHHKGQIAYIRGIIKREKSNAVTS